MPGIKQKRIKRGEVIRADFLNDMAEGIDDATDLLIAAPKHINEALEPALQIAAAEEDAEADDPDTFVEQERTFDEVQVFDDTDTNFATIERIVLISLVNGKGETLKMRINN